MAWGRVGLTVDHQVNARIVERVKARLADKAKQVTAHHLKVGINEADGGAAKLDYKGRPQSVTLAEVARWMEFGTDTIPERPIIRSWFDANEARLKREMTEAIRAEYAGDKEAVTVMGAKWAEELREYFLSGQAPVEGLKTATIGRKAGAGLSHPEVPVVATRQLVNAITAREGRP